MSFIPNGDEDWEEWKSMALRLYAAVSDEGFDCSTLGRFCRSNTTPSARSKRREQVQSSPPTRTGAEKIFKIARAHGWVRKAKPTYSDDDYSDTEAARKNPADRSRTAFGRRSRFPHTILLSTWAYEGEPPPPVWAFCIDTGLGKTKYTIEALAEWLRDEGRGKRVIYMVPQHKLSTEIEKQFIEHGIDARIFRGRGRNDPMHYDPAEAGRDQDKMRLRPKATALASALGLSVLETCCKDGKMTCPLLTNAATSAKCRERTDTFPCGSSRRICCSLRRRRSASPTS